MSELEARLKEMREDVTGWDQIAGEMRKAAHNVAQVKDLKEAFGYLGEKAGVPSAYTTLNDTLRSLAEQADAAFRDVENKLETVIKVYEGKEEENRELVKGVKEGWNF
ncbi:type VII secretion target [Actinomadura oligospora]|uniref:type VII secretion target n=1 Tax=Actinomadura oligospora TaxID=111804 RepID=UPI0004BA5883|nr:hypothetical protein [Actinomadura oligospora]